MSRITVEDCIEVVPSGFELVLVAAQRAKELSSGASLTIPRDKDKNSVVALREIAEKTVQTDALYEGLIRGMQLHRKNDEADSEDMESILAEDESLSRALQLSEQDFEEEDGFSVAEEEEV